MIGRQPKQNPVPPLTVDGVVPAFRHELGLKIRYWVPHVAAAAKGCVVEIEAGEEALFPFASEWRIIPRVQDDTRQKGPGIRFPQQRFVPEPYVRQGVKADVVICPRVTRSRSSTASAGKKPSRRGSGRDGSAHPRGPSTACARSRYGNARTRGSGLIGGARSWRRLCERGGTTILLIRGGEHEQGRELRR